MNETSYYWQGGRKIAIESVPGEMIVVADDGDDALGLTARLEIKARGARRLGGGRVRLGVRGDTELAMERVRSERVAHHVYVHTDDPQTEVLSTDTLFLEFTEETAPSRREEFLAQYALEQVDDLGESTVLARVTDATGRNAIRMANLSAEDPIIASAEPNLLRELSRWQPDGAAPGSLGAPLPADTLFGEQWHLSAPADGPMLAKGAGVDASGAWKITSGRREIVVAVADDGFDLSHPDLQGEGKIAGTLDIRPDGDGIAVGTNVLPRERNYHGTPCAGVAVAELGGGRTVGVAPGCSLLAVRLPLWLTDFQFLKMFRRISAQADVVSCSWGMGPGHQPLSTGLRKGISNLARHGGRRGKGLVFCVAAGNHNCPVQDLGNTTRYDFFDRYGRFRSYRSTIDRWLAAHDEVITVSATTSLKRRSGYSSWGTSINVCAPSSNGDDLRRGLGRGLKVCTIDNEGFGQRTDLSPGSAYTTKFGGTSCSTPIVAGVAALVLSANPTLTAQQVRAVLEETADQDLRLDSETPINSSGDFDDRGFSLWFGYGKVNARRAVERALELLPSNVETVGE